MSISSSEPKSGRLGIHFLESFDSLFLLKADLDLKQKIHVQNYLPYIVVIVIRDLEEEMALKIFRMGSNEGALLTDHLSDPNLKTLRGSPWGGSWEGSGGLVKHLILKSQRHRTCKNINKWIYEDLINI